MLSPSSATIRLFLHVVAATVWVGGQFTLAGLVPTLRAMGNDAPKRVARRFNQFAWPAFIVLVLTGIWNLAAIDIAETSSAYQVTLFLKLAVVAVTGVAAAAHSSGRSRVALAVGGALSGVGSLVALFLGVLLVSGRS